MKKIGLVLFLVISILINALPVRASEYLLAPYDTLSISILNHPELAAEEMVAPDGKISLPLLGRLAVQGKNIGALQKELENGYRLYLYRPQVTVNLKPRPIYVIQEDLGSHRFEVKTAGSVAEAQAFLGGNINFSVEHGGVYRVGVGKTPDFWQENWYKVLTAAAVAVGIYQAVR